MGERSYTVSTRLLDGQNLTLEGSQGYIINEITRKYENREICWKTARDLCGGLGKIFAKEMGKPLKTPSNSEYQ